jgi:hypothetical protein
VLNGMSDVLRDIKLMIATTERNKTSLLQSNQRMHKAGVINVIVTLIKLCLFVDSSYNS